MLSTPPASCSASSAVKPTPAGCNNAARSAHNAAAQPPNVHHSSPAPAGRLRVSSLPTTSRPVPAINRYGYAAITDHPNAARLRKRRQSATPPTAYGYPESPSARRTVPAAVTHQYPYRNSPANAVGWQLARPTRKDAAACTGGKFASENPRPANESDSGGPRLTHPEQSTGRWSAYRR